MPAPGYYRDVDAILYVTNAGTVYYVFGPDTLEPVWWEYDELGDDARPAKLDPEDYARFEKSRVDQGVVK